MTSNESPEGGGRRRRRRRATAPPGPPAPTLPATAAGSPVSPTVAPAPPLPHPPASADAAAPQRGKPARRRRAPRDSSDRGLRDLVGSGPSQLGVSGALRGRDVDRPTEEDLAEAERDVVVVRRHWQPADNRPTGTTSGE